MSRKERNRGRTDRLAAFLESGEHRAASCLARALLAEPGTTDEERARAGAVLASLAPEPIAVVAGLAGAALALLLGIWVGLGGAR
jgi:hypothetical protein